jgi:flagellar biosynthesis/type III secretory pathway protein FliH
MGPRGKNLTSRFSHIVRASAIEVAGPATALPQEQTPVMETNETSLQSRPDPADVEALRALIKAMHTHVEEWRSQRRQTAAEISRIAVEIGVAIAERLLCNEIKTDRQRLDRIVRLSLGRLPAARAVIVRAHPNDVALLQSNEAFDASVSDTLTLRADTGCARGHLILECGEFFVEWDTMKSLAELRKTLLEESLD